MSTPYQVTINGSERADMRDLSLAAASLRLQNMQPDELDLSWSRRRLQTCPLAHNDLVEIWLGMRRIFVGRARIGALTNSGCGIKLVGPWSYLDEQLYQLSLSPSSYGTPNGLVLGDTYTVTLPAGSQVETGGGPITLPVPHTITFTVANRSYYAGYPATTALVDVNAAWTARGWLFRPGGTAGQIYTTIADEWSRLMTFMTVTNAPDLFAVGTVALGGVLAPKVSTVADATVAECVRQVLVMKPDAAVWWDYSGEGLPTMNVRVASLETPVALRIGPADGHVTAGYQVRVADELVPRGVIVRWEGAADPSTGIGNPLLSDFYPGMLVLKSCSMVSGSTTVTCASTAGLVPGMTLTNSTATPGVLIVSITSGTAFVIASAPSASVAGLTLYAIAASGSPASYQPGVLLHTVDEEFPLAPGIAKEVYTSLAVRRGQGSISVLDRNFALGLRPGAVITLADDPMLSGVQLWVQSVTWSPDTGIAQLAVGYPSHLKLKDLVDLRGWFRAAFEGPWWSYSMVVPAP